MISVRKEIAAFADFNNRELLHVDNPHLFVFSRFNLRRSSSSVLVVGNFDARPQHLDLNVVNTAFHMQNSQIKDLYSGEVPALFKNQLVIPAYHFYWLSDFH